MRINRVFDLFNGRIGLKLYKHVINQSDLD